MNTWAEAETTCTECDQRIEWWDDGVGPADWFDPDRHDLETPGNLCPVAINHNPKEDRP